MNKINYFIICNICFHDSINAVVHSGSALVIQKKKKQKVSEKFSARLDGNLVLLEKKQNCGNLIVTTRISIFFEIA